MNNDNLGRNNNYSDSDVDSGSNVSSHPRSQAGNDSTRILAGKRMKKDKGKAKVTKPKWNESDQDEEHDDDHLQKLPVTFIIKFSENSLKDLTIEIENVLETTVSGLKRIIREKMGGITTNRRLRLIHGGRIINDQTNLARDVAKVKFSNQVTNSQDYTTRVYIHCSVGDIFTPEELAKENELDTKRPVQSTMPELRGFDRLRDTGFSEDDIAQLRQQFNSLYGTTNQENPEEATRMEDQWMDTGVGAGVGDAILGEDHLVNLIAILTGMFLGVFALLFLKEKSVFSYSQQRAVVVGIVVNFSFALLRLMI